MTTNFSHTAAYIWSLADLLRGDFKQSQYGRIILPFTILRRLECVLETSKPKVLAEVEKLKAIQQLEETAREKFLLKAAGESFYNTSPMDLSKLGSADIKSNLITYVDSFSKDARDLRALQIWRVHFPARRREPAVQSRAKSRGDGFEPGNHQQPRHGSRLRRVDPPFRGKLE